MSISTAVWPNTCDCDICVSFPSQNRKNVSQIAKYLYWYSPSPPLTFYWSSSNLFTFQWSPLVLNPSYTIMHLLGANKVPWLCSVLHDTAWASMWHPVLAQWTLSCCKCAVVWTRLLKFILSICFCFVSNFVLVSSVLGVKAGFVSWNFFFLILKARKMKDGRMNH